MVNEEANALLNYIFAGIASGTFLFLGINEILFKGLKDRQNKLANIAFYLLGIVIIIVMLMFFGEEHDHGDQEDDDSDE